MLASTRTARCAPAVANQTPYEQSWSLGIERELPSNIVINAEYIGKKGTHLPFSGSNQLNILGPWVESLPTTAPIRTTHARRSTMPASTASWTIHSRHHHRPQQQPVEPDGSVAQLLLPYPQFTGVPTDVRLIANSIYHGLQLVRREAILEWLAVPGDLRLVEIDRRLLTTRTTT